MKRLTPILLALLLSLSACAGQGGISTPDPAASLPVQSAGDPAASLPAQSAPDLSLPEEAASLPENADPSASAPDEGGYYYSLEDVVLYLDAYNTLPDNFITKAEARQLGWSGGSVEHYLEGAAIGGDRFGNREGLLPQASGRSYTECDLNTYRQDSRGAERLVFSNDGLYFHTQDHYETFQQVVVQDGAVVPAED